MQQRRFLQVSKLKCLFQPRFYWENFDCLALKHAKRGNNCIQINYLHLQDVFSFTKVIITANNYCQFTTQRACNLINLPLCNVLWLLQIGPKLNKGRMTKNLSNLCTNILTNIIAIRFDHQKFSLTPLNTSFTFRT